ncbi:aminopeptidase P family protein [Amantichitinum ursilacus]|uniref:Aminopeptidase n=1 Tax=Amantichitinum ursilacus TaxID=857265 RepID=A0A0N0XGJ2_9NEIS|nr:aminopeptidase P family protein [Amantichitinum ursilacus]KPC50114.1 Aminopeptidase [Amantichitinum ursilacus]
MSTQPQIIQDRIAQLRAAMAQAGVDAVVVPSADPHLSEYLPERWQGRAFFSGFNGSVGTLVVTKDFAGVWVDGRYWVQAETQLAGTGVKLMKLLSGQAQPHADWLAANLPAGAVVAADGDVLALGAGKALASALKDQSITLRTDLDVLGDAWANRPTLPSARVYEHTGPQAPVSRASKLQAVRAAMQQAGASWHFISALDDIAWLLNLRGADVEYNPVFLAHALISVDQVTLFIGDDKIDAALQSALAQDGVQLQPYDQATAALRALPADAVVLADPARTTVGIIGAVPASARVIEKINPSQLAKSRKTAEEAANVRATMAQDGAALCNFFAWLDKALNVEAITELTIDEKLSAERAKRPGFVSLSFSTIAGFNANGALPHYRALPEAHSEIKGNGLLLIDSGGQYLGGTTDITRVVPVGTVSAAQKRDYTLVLKGVIALSSAKFPRAIRAAMLDGIARAPMWAAGVDYNHGTGHGVGYFMNVHEGPQSIGYFRDAGPDTAMEPGMITSIEPGIYRPQQWGIRIENLVLNTPAESNEFGEFLQFETLTLCPIDTRVIDTSLMRADELAWLNDYHATVRERLLPLVEGAARDWLLERTEPLTA